MPAKKPKLTNDDFCPHCGSTFPREQRDFHLLGHQQKMNEDILLALEGIRQELRELAQSQANSR